MPLHRRLPKRGFTNIFKKEFEIFNIKDLARFESGAEVDRISLIKSGLIKGNKGGIKLLGQGEITYPLTVRLNSVSKSAKEKIERAGGAVVAGS